jgi:hypothetical protein
MMVNNKLERICKENGHGLIEVLSWDLLGSTEEA